MKTPQKAHLHILNPSAHKMVGIALGMSISCTPYGIWEGFSQEISEAQIRVDQGNVSCGNVLVTFLARLP